MSADVTKSMPVEVGQVVIDEDGTEVLITAELIHKAIAVKARLEMGVYITAMSIKELRDNKLYIPMGYRSWNSYCENELPYGRTTINRHLTIADRLFALGEPVENDVPHAVQLSESGAVGTRVSQLSQRTLLQLAKFSETDRMRLMTEGFITLGDGEYSVDDLKKIAGKEFEKKLAELVPKVAKNQELERNNELLETVNKTQKSQLEKAEARLKKLEKLVGDDKKAQIFRDLRYYWNSIGSLKKEFMKQDPTEDELSDLAEVFKSFIIDSNVAIESLND